MQNTQFSTHVQSLINTQNAVQNSKTHTQQAYTKETGQRVYTFTNKELALTSNPQKVRIMLAHYLAKQSIAQVQKNVIIRNAIAKKVNISAKRATVLIRDNIQKVANNLAQYS